MIVSSTAADFVAEQAGKAQAYSMYVKPFLCRSAAKDGLWDGKDFFAVAK